MTTTDLQRRLLAVLDDCAHEMAVDRGVPACNGRDDDSVDCGIGSMHTATALLAQSIARMFDDPTDTAAAAEVVERRIGQLRQAIAVIVDANPVLPR